MTPSTGTTAILLGESLSSTRASSSFGPAVRAGAVVPVRISRTKCRGLKTRLTSSKKARINAATFHPRPFRGSVGDGGDSRGGGDSDGGSDGGTFGLTGGKLLSIAPKLYRKAPFPASRIPGSVAGVSAGSGLNTSQREGRSEGGCN